jgi:DNA polymerase
MSRRSDLHIHLEYFGDLGVAGVSRDPVWRERENAAQGRADAPALDAGRSALDQSGGPGAPNAAGAAPSSAESAAADLQALRDEIGPACMRCKLSGLGRRQVVFGVGNPNADLMFVGEAPGADEDAQGEPFVGRAGQLLTKIIEAIGLRREDVYIANVIKCRPPGNRAPEPDEVATCEPFLFRQIDTIRPKVIVGLGTHATHALLKTDAPISRLRGHVHNFRGGIKLVPTFHPAFLLRSPDRKRDVWEDMKKVRDLLKESSDRE